MCYNFVCGRQKLKSKNDSKNLDLYQACTRHTRNWYQKHGVWRFR